MSTPRSFNVATQQTSPRSSPVPKVDEGVFDKDYSGETKMLSLAPERTLGNTPASSVAPSRATSVLSKRTTGQSNGLFAPRSDAIQEEAPPPLSALHPSSAYGLERATISSQSPQKSPVKSRFHLDLRRRVSRRLSDQSGMQSEEFRYSTSSVDSSSATHDPPRASPEQVGMTKDDSVSPSVDSRLPNPERGAFQWVGVMFDPHDGERPSFDSSHRVLPPRPSAPFPDADVLGEEQETPTFRLRSATEGSLAEALAYPARHSEETTSSETREDIASARPSVDGSEDGTIWRGSRVVPEEEFTVGSTSLNMDHLPSPIEEIPEPEVASFSTPLNELPAPPEVELVPPTPPKPKAIHNRDTMMTQKSNNTSRQHAKMVSGISNFSERSLKVAHLVNLYSQTSNGSPAEPGGKSPVRSRSPNAPKG